MKKKMDIQAISNELSQGSVFFPREREVQASLHEENKADTTPVRPVPPVRDVPLVPETSQTPVKKRMMKSRHPFDIYQDQYESLQEIALEEKKNGGAGSMSAMVREAIDKLIAERRKT